MSSSFQYPGDAGLRYPLSGQVVGAIAEFLRLKGYLKEDWAGASYKTVQRYFQGEPIKPETVEGILDALLDSLILTSQRPTEPWVALGVNLRDWARALVSETLSQWDTLAAMSNGMMFPIVDRRWLPYPLFRLLCLDLGIRWSAYLGLTRGRDGKIDEFLPPLLTQDALRGAIDRLRQQAQPPLTVERLAEAVGVSMNTMEAWRQGKSLPTNENLERLSAVLAAESGRRRPDVELNLRLAVGGAACVGFLEQLCGADLAQDFIKALAKTARWTLPFLQDAPIPETQWNAVMKEIMEHGARATIRALLCGYLALKCDDNVETAADFQALAGPWYDRMNYWAKRVRPISEEDLAAHAVRRGRSKDLQIPREMAQLIHEHTLRLTEFLREEEDLKDLQKKFPFSVTIPGEAIDPVGTFTKKGQRAHSLGDRKTALHYYYKAVKLEPDNATLHYYIGAALGELVARDHRLDLVEEAIRECREALRLDPSWNSPATEIAIILGNAGRIDEAEDAFRRADAVSAKWPHHHFTHGNNLMWLERYADAAVAFRQAIKLRPAHLYSRFGLAAALFKLGDLRGVQRTAKEIKDIGGPVHADPAKWLDLVPKIPNPVLRRADYPSAVGHKEACPCGSGKQHRRCCGRAK